MPTRSPSWHRLGPNDMSFEAKGFRHVAVALRRFLVDRLVTASLREQGTQPQHLDIAYRPGNVNRHVRKPVEHGLCFRGITVAAGPTNVSTGRSCDTENTL